MNNKSVVRVFVGTALVLLVPLVAMQFTGEVVWDMTDFIVAGVLLMGFGLTLTYLVGKAGSSRKKLAVGLAVAIVFVLTWAELAVGLFGTPWAGS